MRRLRHRFARSPLSVVLTYVAPVCLAIALAGCAASLAADRSAGAPAAEKTGSLAMTGDGSPAQMPPTRSARQSAADPFDAYNPLHGRRAPFRLITTASGWSAAEEDAIIAQAITAHEMRRP